MSVNAANTFYVLDFDRTLFDTMRGATLLAEVTTQYDDSLGRALRVHTDALQKAKTTFSLHDFIRERAGDAAATEIGKRFQAEAAHHDLLLEGAKELLDFISESGARAGILTYGSPEGQAIKIASSGLDTLPYLITNQGQKGTLIASWQQGDIFNLPDEYGGTAKVLVLVDDKLISFDGFPTQHTRGYWLRTPLDSDRNVSVAAHVQEVASLSAVITAESELTKA